MIHAGVFLEEQNTAESEIMTVAPLKSVLVRGT